MNLVYLNGNFVPHAQALIPVTDRGFIFGDGVYEVTRAIGGRLFEWKRHAARLQKSLLALRLNLAQGMDEIERLSKELLLRNGLTAGDAYVYVQVSRGAAMRTHYFPPEGTPCTLYAYASAVKPVDDMRRKGVAAITTPDVRWSRCDIKSVNLIPNIMAKQMAVEAGAHEALFVRDGVVTEASHSNVFAVIDGWLRTYPSSNYILPGVTRAITLELAHALNLKVSEAPFLAQDIARASEVFVTATNSGILPVVSVDGKQVGTGKPGPLALMLAEAMAQLQYGGEKARSAAAQ